MSGGIEVIVRVSGRRFWSVEQKLTMLRDAFGPGGSLERVGQLYAIEAEIRGLSADVRRTTRQAQSRPLVTALRVALDDALRKLAPKSLMTKAIRYGTKRWDAFKRFLDDGRLEIDNNIAKCAIRPIAIGRKNWLFAGSQPDGERAAAIYPVIETAKMNGLEPQAYIADVIAKIAADWAAARWDDCCHGTGGRRTIKRSQKPLESRSPGRAYDQEGLTNGCPVDVLDIAV